MMHSVKLICVVLTLLLTRARGLKLLFLDVPPAADKFSPVTLRCEYDLEGRNLYSVKWYKDGSEFFRYMPDYDPQSQAVKTSGIIVDLQRSDMNKVTLTSLRFNNSGNYKCEVSTEGPNFETVAQHSNMTVMAYPYEDPMIEGVLSTYSLGDYVSANCTSGKSNPPATLTWRINGLNASHVADTWIWDFREGMEGADSQGLYTKTLGLYFQINSVSLIPRIEIRCTAIVGDNVRYRAVYPTIVRALSNKLAQERQINAAGSLAATTWKTIFILMTALQMVYSS